MDKLKELLSKCKCGVYISVNEHRDMYETIQAKIEDILKRDLEAGGMGDLIEEDVQKKMIETDTLISIHFYPSTPIGFYEVHHYDIDLALDEALDCV